MGSIQAAGSEPMQNHRDSYLESASNLIRRGRFSDALLSLQQEEPISISGAQLHRSLLADALQRTGRDQEAETIALSNLKLSPLAPDLAARCRYVLGNVARERGDIQKAIEHFQAAERLVGADLELLCWIQLRLVATVSELAGSETAMGRLAELKRTLTRCGDARPFAALHLWIAETESTHGSLDSARRHLRIAQSLLMQVDDVWLQGYLAINSFGVSYHCAEILEARKWAELAIDYSKLSGHRGARRAAHANLGHIEFSLGHLLEAEECFESALDCCEVGSASYIAVLDSLAQIKLQQDDLAGCGQLVDKIESLSIEREHSKPTHYRTWALQTKIQLLLKQGRVKEAKQVCDVMSFHSQANPQPRVYTSLRLLAIETRIWNDDLPGAAQELGSLLSASVELPPDLFAEAERLIGRILLSYRPGCGTVHLQRAINTFDALGHEIGKKGAVADSLQLSTQTNEIVESLSARCSLDRVRTLLEMRKRPELYGREAVELLKDLDCADNIAIRTCHDSKGDEAAGLSGNSSLAQAKGVLSVDLGTTNQHHFVLEFQPRNDPASIVASLSFQRVIERILAIRTPAAELAGCEVLWSTTQGSTTREIIFASESMLQILKMISKIAPTNLNVLVTGETGTGKEVIAKAIHSHSDRVSKPFMAFNCAAVPKELLESQLFGHKRGAFSGAHEHFQGVIRAAAGGSLLLDEVGEIPLDIQPKLLRFLETGEIHPLGEARPLKVDVRLLFATNADLEEAVKQRRFREDLFFRMNVIPIKIPPLRERREEIPVLANLFARRFSQELSKEPMKFAAETMERLILYSWPGNVRQLGNEVRRMIAMVEDDSIMSAHLLSPEILGTSRLEPSQSEAPQITLLLDQAMTKAVSRLERSMVEYAMTQTGGRVASAARLLGLSRKGLYLKRQRLGLLNVASDASRSSFHS